MRFQLFAFGIFIAFLCSFPVAGAGTWQAGTARLNITPKQNMWASGYSDRTRPSQGKLTDLWAKAIVLEDNGHRRVVLVTMDLVGIDRQLSNNVSAVVVEKCELDFYAHQKHSSANVIGIHVNFGFIHYEGFGTLCMQKAQKINDMR